jgi:hypothetical protein
MEKLVLYFNNLSDSIQVENSRISLSANNADKGILKEKVLFNAFQNHLPKSLTPTYGGTIFGYDDSESKQIDIIISQNIAINFNSGGKMFTPIEAVASVISVKSNLNKDELIDSLTNIASIPQISNEVFEIRHGFTNPLIAAATKSQVDSFIEKQPSLHVFAYNGISSVTLHQHIKEFYAANPHIPQNRRPGTIIVNGKYYFTTSRLERTYYDGRKIPANTYFQQDIHHDLRGAPLIHMIHCISDYVDWLPFIRINHDKYLMKAMNQVAGKIKL